MALSRRIRSAIGGWVVKSPLMALPCSGLVLAMLATILILTGLWLQRRAYKPLRDDQLKASLKGVQA